jgi:hypothetical protein
MSIGLLLNGKMGELTIFPSGLSTAQRTALECNQANYYTIPVLAPNISLGPTNPISLGTTTASLPYSYTTATNYSITWSTAATLAGFANVTNALLPAASIPIAVPAVGPVGGQNYAGVLTVTNNCSGLSTNYGFNIYIIGNNVLDNLNLTAATPSAVAYGLRRLSSFYTAAALRIRRSSDGEQRDVYFDGTGALSLTSVVSAAGGGAATATTLGSWIGANSGTVAVWYDQSGLGRNAFQTTAAAQPRVILNGVIELQNGKPTLIFSGAQSFQTTATTTQCVGAGVNTTSNFVFQSALTPFNARPLSDEAGYQIGLNIGAPNIYTVFTIPAYNGTSITNTEWANYSIGTFLRNGTLAEVWNNSTNRFSSNTISGTVSGTTTMSIGLSFNGKMGELTIFPNALSTAQRTALECNQANYYTMPVLAPNISLGPTNPISLGTTTASLPYSYTTATNYSITWGAAALSAGFANVPSTLLPASSIPLAVPASGPVAGQNYTGVLTVTNNCSGLSTNYSFNIYILGNNVLNNLNLTAATPAAVAFGLRKLTSVYNGAALQIRRSSDGEQRDVYFDGTGALSLTSLVSAAGGGDPTPTTLSSWIGGNSGTVAVWYDQSGLGRNAFQTTAAAQPRVILNGVIELQNGKPRLPPRSVWVPV